MPKGQKFGGRVKGTPNKVTSELKDMILTALDGAGGATYLQRQAEENPGPFMALVGKVLPLQMANPDGSKIQVPAMVFYALQKQAEDG